MAAEHILVVENDKGVRDLLQEALQAEGYRVTVVDGGASMRDFLGTDVSVDLVVLDAATPGEGISLALHLKGLRIPLVMMSGNPEIMEFALNDNLQLLSKPFKIGDLGAAIASAFGSGEFGQRDNA